MVWGVVGLLNIILAEIIILRLTYFLQIKEYRWDRFVAGIHDTGWQRIFFPMDIRLPAKSLRNLIVFFVSSFGVVVLSIFGCYRIFVIDGWGTSLFWMVSSIAAAYILPFCTVLLTYPIAYLKKVTLVRRARKLLQNSNVKVIGITGSYGKTSVKEFLSINKFHFYLLYS